MKGGNSEGVSPFRICSPAERHQSVYRFMDFPLKLHRIVAGEALSQFRFGLIGKIR